jgi:hypothetical protein
VPSGTSQCPGVSTRGDRGERFRAPPDSGYPLGWESLLGFRRGSGVEGWPVGGYDQAGAPAGANRGEMTPKGWPVRVIVDGVGLAYDERGHPQWRDGLSTGPICLIRKR